jgi:hypothetical protein
MLAMDVNDNAGTLNARVALTSIASVLAPTEGEQHLQYRPVTVLQLWRADTCDLAFSCRQTDWASSSRS